MPNLKALKSALGLGQEELRSAFKILSKGKDKKLFRQNSYSLPSTEFDEDMQFTLGPSMNPVGEPGGIYYATHPYDISGLVTGASTSRNAAKELYKQLGGLRHEKVLPFDQISTPLEDARIKVFTKEEWIDENSKKSFNQLTRELKANYDFISFPDIVAGTDKMQMVQLNPNKALTRLDEGSKGNPIYKILGLSSALGLSQTEESEASPVGTLIKKGSQALKPILKSGLSSASEHLKGLTLEGKTIKEVRTGTGDWRNIIFTNGDSLPVTKDYINSLSREVGTSKKMQELSVKGNEAQLQQARNSLKFHLERTLPVSKEYVKVHAERLKQQVKDISGESGNELIGVYHKGKYLIMPRQYAELLEKSGDVKIDRSKKGLINQ